MKRHQQYYTGPRRKVGPTIGLKVLLKRLYKDTIWYFRVELGHWLLGEKEEHYLGRFNHGYHGIEYKGSEGLLNIIKAGADECKRYSPAPRSSSPLEWSSDWKPPEIKNPRSKQWKTDASLFLTTGIEHKEKAPAPGTPEADAQIFS